MLCHTHMMWVGDDIMCLPSDGERGDDSDREGSLTPTNEAPPTLELPEEPTTPKDEDVGSNSLREI